MSSIFSALRFPGRTLRIYMPIPIVFFASLPGRLADRTALKLRGVKLVLAIGLCAGSAQASNLVDSIIKAPIVPDGDVAGAPTDLTINLAIDPDPSVPGLLLTSGETIEITLPESFVFADPGGHPIRDLFSSPNCSFEHLACSTALLLHGWPQHPILPSFPPGEIPTYEIEYDLKRNRIALMVRRPLADAPLPGPGVKQVHLMLLGFRNPERPGVYPIQVKIHGADGHSRGGGEGRVNIRPSIAPSLNVTTIFDDNGSEPPNLNTIYQVTAPGESAPLPWDFLVWDADGEALSGLTVQQTSVSAGLLVRDGKIVGRFAIEAPPGAKGHRLEGGPSVALESEPVFGALIPTGHFTVRFTAGSKPGRYRTVLELDGGEPVEMYVDAER